MKLGCHHRLPRVFVLPWLALFLLFVLVGPLSDAGSHAASWQMAMAEDEADPEEPRSGDSGHGADCSLVLPGELRLAAFPAASVQPEADDVRPLPFAVNRSAPRAPPLA